MAVVRPTKAVSVTRKTFSGSMKNSSSPARTGPEETTRAVSTQAAAKVAKLKPALMSRAKARCPVNARTTLPSRGMPRTKNSDSTSVVLQLLEVTDVEAVELLADLEHEDADDQDADQ